MIRSLCQWGSGQRGSFCAHGYMLTRTADVDALSVCRKKASGTSTGKNPPKQQRRAKGAVALISAPPTQLPGGAAGGGAGQLLPATVRGRSRPLGIPDTERVLSSRSEEVLASLPRHTMQWEADFASSTRECGSLTAAPSGV